MAKFKKGCIPWNKGIKWKEMSGENHPMWGKTHTKKARIKISDGNKGKKKPVGAYSFPKGHKINLGRKQSIKEREKRSKIAKERGFGKWMEGRGGEKHWNWQGGITKEYTRISRQKRKLLERNAKGAFTLGEWEVLKKQYGYICPCCKKKEPEIKLNPDHIIPLIKGGSNYIENIQPLCRSCNCKKHTKIIKYRRIQ